MSQPINYMTKKFINSSNLDFPVLKVSKGYPVPQLKTTRQSMLRMSDQPIFRTPNSTDVRD